MENALNTLRSTLALAVMAAAFAGCAIQQPMRQAPAQGSAPSYGAVQYGEVQSIDTVRSQSQTSGGGALLGAAAGALIGHQIDHGNTKAGATLVGIVGGALIGNEIEKNQHGAREFYRVAVRLEGGAVRAFDYQQLSDIRVGDRVRVENNQVYRY
jgi:outer membrane lipoprotein SlyB